MKDEHSLAAVKLLMHVPTWILVQDACTTLHTVVTEVGVVRLVTSTKILSGLCGLINMMEVPASEHARETG